MSTQSNYATALRKVSKIKTKEYMPEVGEPCEVYDSSSHRWNVIGINAIGRDFLLVDDKGYEVCLPKTSLFRPIEARQETEREEAIASLIKIIKDEHKNDTVLAERILNSGYRKLGDEASLNDIYRKFPNGEASFIPFIEQFKVYPRGE